MQSTTSAAPGPGATAGPSVLIVEDNPDASIIYSMMLAHAGFQVLVAPDGAEGLAVARRERPDVILMDIAMPVMDGLAATRLLKADAATATIPIVVLTAHALAGDRERALAAGADDYRTKPIEPRAVRDVVQSWVARGPLAARGALAPLADDGAAHHRA